MYAKCKKGENFTIHQHALYSSSVSLNLLRVVASPLVPCDIFFSHSSSAIGLSAYGSNVSSPSHVLLVSRTLSIASTSTLSNSFWLLSSAVCSLSVSDKFSSMEYTYLELIFSFLPVNLTIFFLPRTDFSEGQSECTDTRAPKSTSQTMSRGPIVSQSAFLSAGWIDRNKIGFQRFAKFIKKFAFHTNRKIFSRKFFG